MFGVLFKLIFLATGAFLVCFAAGLALRNARRLNQRIAQFKAEQKETEEQGRALPPYMALAELYTEEDKGTSKATQGANLLRGTKERR